MPSDRGVFRETIAKATTFFYGVSCVCSTRDSRRAQEKHRAKICPFCPFVLNDLVLSLLSLECPFRPVLCPFCPSHKRLKFAGTVYDTKFIGNLKGLSGIKGRKVTF